MDDEKCSIVVALLGPPNSGKTTLFNTITGSSELVANWPGATVEVKTAVIEADPGRICVVDLPGTYSVLGDTAEEEVTRQFLTGSRVDVLLLLADSTTLERSLYLPLEVLSLYDRPAVLVLTKADEAEKLGIRIDVEGLSKALGVPVVLVSALKRRGVDLLNKILAEEPRGPRRPLRLSFGRLEPYLSRLEETMKRLGLGEAEARRLALALLQGREWARREASRLLGEAAVRALEEAERLRREALANGIDPLAEAAGAIYEEASQLHRAYVSLPGAADAGLTRLDRLLLHPLAGPLLSGLIAFLAIIVAYAVATGSPLDELLRLAGLPGAAALLDKYNAMALFSDALLALARWVEAVIPNKVLARLIGEGLLSPNYGVGLVITFLPLIAVMMAILGALEDSGFLPRIAAGFDPVLRRFGVSGKALFPILVSFGCNVPGVLSARIMESAEEREALIFALPLIPCMARMFVIMAFAQVFFVGVQRALVVALVYSIALAAFLATLRIYMAVKHVEPVDFILEFPRIKPPSPRVVWWFVWDKLKHFLVKAGTIIAVASIVFWLLANYGPHGYAPPPPQSYAAELGRLLSPYVEAIMGVNKSLSWSIGFGLIGGFIAKEAFLDSLAAVSPAPNASGAFATLRAYHLPPSQALSVLVAVTLYVPCVATLATMYSESRNPRLVAAALAYDFTVATLAALAVRLLASII